MDMCRCRSHAWTDPETRSRSGRIVSVLIEGPRSLVYAPGFLFHRFIPVASFVAHFSEQLERIPCRLRARPLGHVALLVLLGLFLGILPAHAQGPDSTQLRRFRAADAHLQSGEADRAIEILETLYDEAPENNSFYRKLKQAYESVKRYEDALRLLEGRIDGRPTAHLLSEKAYLQYQMGKEETAAATWRDALAQAPKDPTTYRVVYQTLVELRRFNRAIDVLQQAREEIGNDTLFRSELAYLYGLDGQHEKAMHEYVALLRRSPDRLSLVRNRLQSLIERNEGVDASLKVLQETVEDDPLNTTFRKLLAWLHMNLENYEAAYDVHRALDRLRQERGEGLYRFAQNAADAEHFSVAIRALETVLEQYPEASVAPEAQRTLGDTYRRWAEHEGEDAQQQTGGLSRYAAAREAYETYLTQYPNHRSRADVLAELGSIEVDVYHDLEAGQTTLEKILANYPGSSAADRARYDLARIALLQNNFDHARLLLSRLANDLRSGDLADRARFELARLQFYDAAFDAARARAQSISANTSADVSNDAIELKVLIQENRGPDSLDTPLRLYAAAQLYERQRRPYRALAHLDSILTVYPRHSLADEARFNRADISLTQGDTAAALQHYQAVPQQHPRSPFADRSLFRMASLHADQNRTAEAIEMYDRLLTEYPQSLLATEARVRLRALQRTRS